MISVYCNTVEDDPFQTIPKCINMCLICTVAFIRFLGVTSIQISYFTKTRRHATAKWILKLWLTLW